MASQCLDKNSITKHVETKQTELSRGFETFCEPGKLHKRHEKKQLTNLPAQVLGSLSRMPATFKKGKKNQK